MMKKNWMNVALNEHQATFIETLKSAIMEDYGIKVSTNDVLARIVYLGLETLNREQLIKNPMLVFQGGE
tara:strand:- start:332 stop:538 length:207 start_codon:yes stop_codon:yes gene_type:complete